ncbi:MAG: flavin reductase [Saprospiraceae bacterium]|nr:flavin reductase [Saprospiraceae bacterium]
MLIPLTVEKGLWKHFFTVSPLIIVGSRENDAYNLAPKHMATPVGQSTFFAFVCTPRHNTYHNIQTHGYFTVSFPKPKQILHSSLLADPRPDRAEPKWMVDATKTVKASLVDSLIVKDAYLALECELDRIVDGFDDYSIIIGSIVAAAIDQNSIRAEEQDDQEMIFNNPLLAYLPYGRFAEIKDTLAFPFPKGFKELPK